MKFATSSRLEFLDTLIHGRWSRVSLIGRLYLIDNFIMDAILFDKSIPYVFHYLAFTKQKININYLLFINRTRKIIKSKYVVSSPVQGRVWWLSLLVTWTLVQTFSSEWTFWGLEIPFFVVYFQGIESSL